MLWLIKYFHVLMADPKFIASRTGCQYWLRPAQKFLFEFAEIDRLIRLVEPTILVFTGRLFANDSPLCLIVDLGLRANFVLAV